MYYQCIIRTFEKVNVIANCIIHAKELKKHREKEKIKNKLSKLAQNPYSDKYNKKKSGEVMSQTHARFGVIT